ncbi:hypothetical protein PGIGA_G00036320 [Pangasianodon gigas]|uniref:Uncharacterized protein n=1 Tax=Pangasianodon gigas TaxID=30993 RepID=A0ACC5WZL0_PANGG|nr:hypothetical protein [Pangasianodon gigas]
MIEALRMCARLIPNLPGTGVIPVGPISFNEALVVVFALPLLSGISSKVSKQVSCCRDTQGNQSQAHKGFVTTLSMDVVLRRWTDWEAGDRV